MRGLVFDMDGVLVDSEPLWREAEMEVFAGVGLHLTEADCESTMGMRTDEVVTYLMQKNPIQAFVIRMFKEMTSQSIPDLFGHLKPLFIADKVAKYYYSQFKNMVESTGTWLMNKRELREFLFYLSTFRERRTDIERTRKTS